MATVTQSVRLSEERKRELEELSRVTGRSANHHINAALDEYLTRVGWQIDHLRAGLDDLEAGRVVSHDEAVSGFIGAGLFTQEEYDAEAADIEAAMRADVAAERGRVS